MRGWCAAATALFLGACASGPPIEPPTAVADQEEAPCLDCGELTEASWPTAPVEDTEIACVEAAGFAKSGEHKPAVDALAAIREGGSTCPEQVLESVAVSEQHLGRADEFAKRGLEAWREGDAASAREHFVQALEAYPKYYWVQKLIQDLAVDPAAEVSRYRERAATLRGVGRSEEALEALEEAGEVAPSDAALRAEIALLRTELGDARLGEAYRAQRAGDLARALELTVRAIDFQPDYPVRDRLIDFARRLGLRLFSAGEFVKARGLWQAALALDVGNELLRQYIEEVDARLESLAEISKSSGD